MEWEICMQRTLLLLPSIQVNIMAIVRNFDVKSVEHKMIATTVNTRFLSNFLARKLYPQDSGFVLRHVEKDYIWIRNWINSANYTPFTHFFNNLDSRFQEFNNIENNQKWHITSSCQTREIFGAAAPWKRSQNHEKERENLKSYTRILRFLLYIRKFKKKLMMRKLIIYTIDSIKTIKNIHFFGWPYPICLSR